MSVAKVTPNGKCFSCGQVWLGIAIGVIGFGSGWLIGWWNDTVMKRQCKITWESSIRTPFLFALYGLLLSLLVLLIVRLVDANSRKPIVVMNYQTTTPVSSTELVPVTRTPNITSPVSPVNKPKNAPPTLNPGQVSLPMVI